MLEENKALVRRYCQKTMGDLTAIDSCLTSA